jgi:hypothetical protein
MNANKEKIKKKSNINPNVKRENLKFKTRNAKVGEKFKTT